MTHKDVWRYLALLLCFLVWGCPVADHNLPPLGDAVIRYVERH